MHSRLLGKQPADIFASVRRRWKRYASSVLASAAANNFQAAARQPCALPEPGSSRAGREAGNNRWDHEHLPKTTRVLRSLHSDTLLLCCPILLFTFQQAAWKRKWRLDRKINKYKISQKNKNHRLLLSNYIYNYILVQWGAHQAAFLLFYLKHPLSSWWF